MEVTITVNGRVHRRDVEPRTLLVDFLRDYLGLTGANVGCDTTQCGSCTIHLDGRAVKSCTVLAVQADATEVVTVEGLASDGLHPMQEAFREAHGLQCGYCTPGIIMTAVKLVESADGSPSEEEIRHGLEGNLCRCTGYQNIVRAVRLAADRMRAREA